MKKTLSISFFIVFLFSILQITAQPSIVWQKSQGDSWDDRLYSVIETTDQGYLTVGYTETGGSSNLKETRDFWVGKFNQNGNLEWENTYGGSEEDRAEDVIQTSDGGYLISGSSRSSDNDVNNTNNGLADFWLLKIDVTGNLQWEKSFGGSNADSATKLLETDEGYLVLGYSFSSNFIPNNGESDVYLAKVNFDGEISWQHNYGGTEVDYAFDIKQTEDGGYIIGAHGGGPGEVMVGQITHGHWEVYLIKVDANGLLQWEDTYGGSGKEYVGEILVIPNDGYLIGGSTASNDGDVSYNNGSFDVWVIKLSENGNLEWEKTYGGTSSDILSTISSTPDDGFVFVSSSHSSDVDVNGNYGLSDYWLAKLSQAGDIEWQKNIGGSNFDNAKSSTLTSDNGIVIAGYSKSNDFDVASNAGEEDLMLIKLQPILENTISSFDDLTELNNQYFKLGPNPSKGVFSIDFIGVARPNSIHISNISGEIIYQQSKVMSQANFSIAHNGSYTIILDYGEFKLVEKLIVVN